ncbi:MAG TPA: methyltransferase domain-containing protein [Solirubrobacteraceae bacterium]|nr:methyltransferase domain-containing protein [Solirubrobacteraceae bacterium]
MPSVQGVDPSLRDDVQALRWFHRIELAPGLITPGQDESQAKLAQIRLPERLDGWSVLDLGAWDGFFSFEAERRGASRVVAVDPECWREPAWGPDGWGTKRPFELARRALGSQVEDLDIDLQDISPETVGRFDLVLLLGVFYHLPDPLAVMRAAASVCERMIIVETHADLLDLKRPAMAYYPGEVDGDESNWWGPNEALLRALLETDGFTRTEGFTDSRARRAARSLARRARRQPYRYQWGRLVVHGWR